MCFYSQGDCLLDKHGEKRTEEPFEPLASVRLCILPSPTTRQFALNGVEQARNADAALFAQEAGGMLTPVKIDTVVHEFKEIGPRLQAIRRITKPPAHARFSQSGRRHQGGPGEFKMSCASVPRSRGPPRLAALSPTSAPTLCFGERSASPYRDHRRHAPFWVCRTGTTKKQGPSRPITTWEISSPGSPRSGEPLSAQSNH